MSPFFYLYILQSEAEPDRFLHWLHPRSPGAFAAAQMQEGCAHREVETLATEDLHRAVG
jgi:hypothetical protein